MTLGIVVLNSGGTMGHLSMIEGLLDPPGTLVGLESVVITDAPSVVSALRGRPLVRCVLLPAFAHQHSIAGCLRNADVEAVVSALRDHDCDSVVFSTFFHRGILELLAEAGLPSDLLTFPLRDSQWRAFLHRRFDRLFRHVLVFEDLYQPAIPAANQRAVSYVPRRTCLWADHARALPRALVLVGGGGRPAAGQTPRGARGGVREYRRRGGGLSLHMSVGVRGNVTERAGVDQLVGWKDRLGAWAAEYDLVISEAGICAVAELAAMGVPTILVPGARRLDNQELRALEFERAGGGICVLPEEGAAVLADAIACLLERDERRSQCHAAALRISQSLTRFPEAADLVRVHVADPSVVAEP